MIQKDPCGHGHVERVRAALHGDSDSAVARVDDRCLQPITFVAKQQSEPIRSAGGPQRFGSPVQHRCRHLDAPLTAQPCEVSDQVLGLHK